MNIRADVKFELPNQWRCTMSVLTRITKAIPVAAVFLMLLILTSCNTSASDAEPTPTPLPTPVVAEKPTYIVQRGPVTKSLEFTGRVGPVKQQDLFFRSDGFVRNVKVERNAQVKTGDLLADLEIVDLENQLAEAQLKLKEAERTSNTSLADAETESEKAAPGASDTRAYPWVDGTLDCILANFFEGTHTIL